ELDAWPRERIFSECGLPWVPPSPNMPTPETALAYAGTCLFEGVNMNEGRGTDTPFLLIGAPWLDAEAVAGTIVENERPGCRLEPVRYTPVPIPGKASKPAYQNVPCAGIRIVIEDAPRVRSFTLALALLCAIRRRHPDDLKFTPHFDALAGTSDLRQRILGGEPALEIVARYEKDLRRFDATRPRLYQ
ncbi:MAG: DUF1343 domain-containing protein, partial [Candidatus Hydrogenedentes bacterium]|nr:DUF1343 domain-containing protein [Candidatus Hydrogenedentota bacterium]